VSSLHTQLEGPQVWDDSEGDQRKRHSFCLFCLRGNYRLWNKTGRFPLLGLTCWETSVSGCRRDGGRHGTFWIL